jgi:hypothetical protein
MRNSTQRHGDVKLPRNLFSIGYSSEWFHRPSEKWVENIIIKLTHGSSVQSLWDAPDLLMSQCCSYDLIGRFRNILIPVAEANFSALDVPI